MTNGHAPPPLRFAIYARVSSVEQAGPDSASIETQLANCLTLVEREGGAVVDRYVDDKTYKVGGRTVEPSGERADRPEFQRMLADIRAGKVNAVAAWHEWRLYRDFRPFVDFIEVARVQKPAVRLWHGQWSEQFAVFGAWMGKADNDHRTAQTMKGRRAKAEKGFAATGMPLFYRTVRNDKGKRVGAELRPEYGAWLADLARLFLSGLTYDEIALQLGDNPATGRRIQKSGVISILKNKFLRGLIDIDRWSTAPNRMLVAGKHTPAWDEATCLAIERELERRARHGRSIAHSGSFTFSGLLRCGYAGSGKLMTGIKGTKRPWVTYNCRMSWRVKHGYESGVAHPPNNLSEIKVRALLQQVGEHITEDMAWAEAQRHVKTLPTVPNAWHAEVAKLRTDLAEIVAELDALPAAARRSRAGLEDDQRRMARRLAALEEVAPPIDLPAVDPEVLAVAIMDFYRLDFATAAPDEIRSKFPWDALYLRAGELVPPP